MSSPTGGEPPDPGGGRRRGGSGFATSAPTDSVLEQHMARRRAQQGQAAAPADADDGGGNHGSGLPSPPIVSPPPTMAVGSPDPLFPSHGSGSGRTTLAGMVRAETVRLATKSGIPPLPLPSPPTATASAAAASSKRATGVVVAGGSSAHTPAAGNGPTPGGPKLGMKRVNTVGGLVAGAATTRGVTEEGMGVVVVAPPHAAAAALDFSAALDERARGQLAQNLWCVAFSVGIMYEWVVDGSLCSALLGQRVRVMSLWGPHFFAVR